VAVVPAYRSHIESVSGASVGSVSNEAETGTPGRYGWLATVEGSIRRKRLPFLRVDQYVPSRESGLMQVNKRRMALAALMVAGVLGSLALPSGAAFADTKSGHGWTNDNQNFFTGATSYTQTHSFDDIGLAITDGIAVDSRWQKCTDPGVIGHIIYDVRPRQGTYTIGTNFAAGTCLKLQYRAFTTGGDFWTQVRYNTNWI
jgi:hypothetical protein